MVRGKYTAGLVGVALAGSAIQPVQAAPAPIVFFDIAGPDAAKQAAFYHEVFAWTVGPAGALSVPISGNPLNAALRQDPADKIIYLGVEDIEATLAQVAAHGGRIVQHRFAIKGVAAIGLFADPAGNSMGLVQIKDGQVWVP